MLCVCVCVCGVCVCVWSQGTWGQQQATGSGKAAAAERGEGCPHRLRVTKGLSTANVKAQGSAEPSTTGPTSFHVSVALSGRSLNATSRVPGVTCEKASSGQTDETTSWPSSQVKPSH